MNYTFKILKTESPKITALEIRRTSTVVQAFGSHVEEKYTVVFISKKEEKTKHTSALAFASVDVHSTESIKFHFTGEQ